MGVDPMSIITRYIGRLNVELRLSIRISERSLHTIEHQRHIRFFDPENLGVDTRIVILCQLRISILRLLLDDNCIIKYQRHITITCPLYHDIFLCSYNVSKYNLVFRIDTAILS